MRRLRRGRRLTLVLGFAALLVAGLALRERAHEEWCLWWLESDDPVARRDAAKALGTMRSSRAFPRLAQALEETVVENGFVLAGSQAQRPFYAHPDTGHSGEQILRPYLDSLTMIVGNDTPAIRRHLLDGLQSDEPRVRALNACLVGELDDRARPLAFSLAVLLADDNAIVRLIAVRSLAEIGSAAIDALPELAAAATDSDLTRDAIDALVAIGPASVSVLLELLQSQNPYVRARAASAVSRMSPTPKAAIPLLVEALEDDYWSLRRNAAAALGAFGRAADVSVPRLESLLNDNVREVRDAARDALRRIQRTRISAPGED